MQVLCGFREARCGADGGAVEHEYQPFEGLGGFQGGQGVVPQFAVAGGVEEEEFGADARRVVVFAAEAVFEGGVARGELAEGGLRCLAGVRGGGGAVGELEGVVSGCCSDIEGCRSVATY